MNWVKFQKTVKFLKQANQVVVLGRVQENVVVDDLYEKIINLLDP
jgi:hypothetical protein